MSAHTHTRRAITPPATATPAPTHRTAAPGGCGQALEQKTQRRMSALFGHDFSQIRVHTDARAGESARMAGANAYTLGTDIVFGSGAYTPGSPDTERLLAHELTHVAQQSRFGPGDPLRPSRRGDASEQEADRLSTEVLAGRRVDVRSAPGAAMARDENEPNMTPATPNTSFPGDLAAGLPPNINPFGPTLPAPPDPLGPTQFPDVPLDPVNPVIPKAPPVPNIPEPPPGGFPQAPPSPATGASGGGGFLDTLLGVAGAIGGALIDIFPPVPTSLLHPEGRADDA